LAVLIHMGAIEIIPTSVPHSSDEFAHASALAATFAQRIHHDVGDGVFAHEVTWPYVKFKTIGELSYQGLGGITIDAHLMVEEPHTVAQRFLDAGVSRLTVHVEAFPHPEDIQTSAHIWRSRGVEVGLALLIDTPFDVLENLRSSMDFVHLMTIPSIGRQGIRFDPRAIDRVKSVHTKFPDLLICVDGGINAENIADLVRTGARRFCVGAAIMQASDPFAAYNVLKNAAESAL